MLGLGAWRQRRGAANLLRFENDVELLRLAIAAAVRSSDARTIALIGQRPGAGTTTLAVWLARSLAREGRRTLLVDSNFARPRLHDIFRAEARGGVADLEAGSVGASEVLVETRDPNLSFVPCGSGRPAMTTSVERWRSLLLGLTQDRFGLVDAGSSDSPMALTLAAASDAAVLVIPSGCPRQEIESTRRRVLLSDTKILGVVLNQRRYPVPEAIYRRL